MAGSDIFIDAGDNHHPAGAGALRTGTPPVGKNKNADGRATDPDHRYNGFADACRTRGAPADETDTDNPAEKVPCFVPIVSAAITLEDQGCIGAAKSETVGHNTIQRDALATFGHKRHTLGSRIRINNIG